MIKNIFGSYARTAMTLSANYQIISKHKVASSTECQTFASTGKIVKSAGLVEWRREAATGPYRLHCHSIVGCESPAALELLVGACCFVSAKQHTHRIIATHILLRAAARNQCKAMIWKGTKVLFIYSMHDKELKTKPTTSIFVCRFIP